MMTRTHEQEEIDAQYNQMCIAVDRLSEEIRKALERLTDA
jgi:hypothetical protein